MSRPDREPLDGLGWICELRFVVFRCTSQAPSTWDLSVMRHASPFPREGLSSLAFPALDRDAVGHSFVDAFAHGFLATLYRADGGCP